MGTSPTTPQNLDWSAFARCSPQSLARLTDRQLADLEFGLEDAVDQRCGEDALYWAQTWTLTENPKYLQQGREFRAPFPRKSYFVPLFEEFRKRSRLFVPKTREMLTSWCVMAYACSMAQWHRAEVIVQTDKEDKASELVGYAEALQRNQKLWMKQRHPLKQPASRLALEWASGGRIFGIPKGVNQMRLYHPTLYVMDEAAFLPEAEACYNVAHPVCSQIIAISSAGPGWFGDECSR